MKISVLRAVVLSGLALGACSDSPTDVPEPFIGCDRVASIEVGRSVLATLDPSDCRERAGAYVDLYELRLSATRGVSLYVSSVQFDPYLVLLERSTDRTVAQNNDVDIFTTDSSIQAALPAGTYIIVVTSFRVGEEGRYRLEVDPAP